MTEYRIFDPKVKKPCHLLERKEARAAYDWYIESIPERIGVLKDLAEEFGCSILCGSNFLEPLHDLYFGICSKNEGQGELTALELSVASDISMYMGNLAVQECNSLTWKLHTFGKSNAHYQRPVIMGFKNVKYSKYSIDFELAINSYGNRLIRNQSKENDLFSMMYTSCLEKS